MCVCVCVCMCVCVCEYMKGLWGKLKCQRGSIYDTVHGIGWHQRGRTERGRKNGQTTKKRLDGTRREKTPPVLCSNGWGGRWKTCTHTHTHTHWMASTYINAMFIYLRQRHPSLGPFVHLLRLLRWEMYSPLRFDSTAERVCCDGRHTHTHTHALPF